MDILVSALVFLLALGFLMVFWLPILVVGAVGFLAYCLKTDPETTSNFIGWWLAIGLVFYGLQKLNGWIEARFNKNKALRN